MKRAKAMTIYVGVVGVAAAVCASPDLAAVLAGLFIMACIITVGRLIWVVYGED